jgi:hypothetical protein
MTPLAPRLPPAVLVLTAVSVALAGCGITDPYTPSHQANTSARPQATTTAATSSQTVTDPSEPPPGTPITTASRGVTASGGNPGARSARQALELYTRLYVNRGSKTIGPHQRQLAALSLGIARAKALQAAASYGRDPALKSSNVANSGSVVLIAPGRGSERGGWVIVTSERTTGQGDYAGLPATAHVTYAHVIHTRNGWIVRQWSLQS